jgi:carbonic anhydrase/acetyltransferase-like protein (isoleucine patch superfamily)
MANSRTQSPTDADRFVAALNRLDHIPNWNEAASLGVPILDLSREEFAIRDALVDLEQARRGFDATVDPGVAEATDADLADHRARLDQIAARPGRYFLGSGAVVQRDDLTGEAYQSGWWYDQRTTLITTPHGERVHRPGIHPDASIDPTAQIDPTARIEAGATIGPRSRIGAHVHIGRDAAIGANSVIQDGSWIGTNADIGAHSWVSYGVTVEPHCVIGHHTTIGAGSGVIQGCQIEPYSRLGAGTTTSRTPSPTANRGVQVANAIENLMRLDRD